MVVSVLQAVVEVWYQQLLSPELKSKARQVDAALQDGNDVITMATEGDVITHRQPL